MYRLVLASIISILLTAPLNSVAQSELRRAESFDPALPKLQIFKEVIEALSAAGDAVKSLTDGIAHLVRTGASGYSYLAASRERDRLIDISASASHLATFNIITVNSIDEYLAKPHPDDWDWRAVQAGIRGTLTNVTTLLADVRAERSDFVLEDAYQRLIQTLGFREALLGKLTLLPPPVTSEEKEALQRINSDYKNLIAQLRDAVKQLNEYLKNKP